MEILHIRPIVLKSRQNKEMELIYSSKENLIPNEKMSLQSDFLRNIAENN
jgi:hypothetical protein